MKKKVGLLTHPLASNYGGILQASILYNYLTDLGFDVILIQKYPAMSFRLRMALKILSHIPFQNFKNIRSGEKSRKRNMMFIEKFIPARSSRLFTTIQLRNLVIAERLHTIVVGSDQVWRMDYIDDGYFGNYFLDFTEGLDIRRIAYAASFGKDYWEAPDKNDVVRRLLSRFDAVSTREVSGIDICKVNFGLSDCKVVLDPTLLVDARFYDVFFEEAVRSSVAKNIATYILDDAEYKSKVVDVVRKEFGCGWDLINAKGIHSNNDVLQWLKTLAEAEFIVTDSFHGLAISIAFKKNFIVIGNKERGLSRFYSLLEQLGLTNRLLLEEGPDNIVKLVHEDIDYELVNKKLEDLRTRSREFLSKSLQLD